MDANLLIIAGRTLLLYIVIMVIFRLMGKREIGELSVLDLIVFLMLSEMAVVSIENPHKHILHQIVPMGILMVLQLVMAFVALKIKKSRSLFDGDPSVLIRQGKIDEKEMKRQRYNFDDLLMQLREKDIGDVREVEYAILETSGKLSVFPKQKSKKSKSTGPKLTLPLILDGEIQEDHLAHIHQTSIWLRQKLRDIGYDDVHTISYCSLQDGQFYVDLKDE